MTLPVTLLVLDVYPLRRHHLGWPALVREKLGHFALAAVAAVVASWAVTRGAGWTSYDVYGLEARLAMTGYSFWFYPWKLVWPERLSPLYELPARIRLLDAAFLWPTVGVVAVTAILLLARRRLAGALAAWLHSIIVLAPVSGIAHAGHQLAHDRYSYLSGLGFAVLAGAGVTWLGRQRARGRVSRWVLGTTVTAIAARPGRTRRGHLGPEPDLARLREPVALGRHGRSRVRAVPPEARRRPADGGPSSRGGSRAHPRHRAAAGAADGAQQPRGSLRGSGPARRGRDRVP